MKRVRTRFGAALAAMTIGASALVAMGGTAHAVTSNPPNPQLTFAGTQTSHPFPGAPGTASDIEGLGYVPSDTSMWVADDNADRVWEINPTTGAYRSQLRGGSGGTDFLDRDQRELRPHLRRHGRPDLPRCRRRDPDRHRGARVPQPHR